MGTSDPAMLKFLALRREQNIDYITANPPLTVGAGPEPDRPKHNDV